MQREECSHTTSADDEIGMKIGRNFKTQVTSRPTESAFLLKRATVATDR